MALKCKRCREDESHEDHGILHLLKEAECRWAVLDSSLRNVVGFLACGSEWWHEGQVIEWTLCELMISLPLLATALIA